jgi:phospholipase C
MKPWVLVAISVCLVGCRDRSPADECKSANAGQVPPTPADPPLICPVAIPADPSAASRSTCTFTAGARVADTLGLPPALASTIPIRHVIVVMKENRSFDQLFGQLHDQGQPASEAVPATFFNLDPEGVAVTPFHAESTCLPTNPDHQWEAIHDAVGDGGMSGFVSNAAESTLTNGHFVMGWFDQGDLPFLYWLANTYALTDRHFSSARTGTFPNRDFLYLGTNDGVQSTGSGFPDESTPTLFQALTAAGLTWGVYSDGAVLSGALGWSHDHPGAYCLGDFFERLDTGTLPNVAFVDGRAGVDDDHPPADVQVGEAWTRNLYQHAVASPQWPRLVMLFTYDEVGGFADHVPPPNACIARPLVQDQPYFELGPRVPLIAISAWSKPHAVSHVVQEHTAITRFIESLFDLPALTARDANSPGLLDLFDFGQCEPPLLHPPAAPDSGVGGCHR